MRNYVIAGAAAAAIVLGASGAYALPSNSPYAIWVPESVDQGMPAPNGAFAGSDSYTTGSSLLQALEPGAMNEGRAAFVAREPSDSGVQIETPEDRTYYSRGR